MLKRSPTLDPSLENLSYVLRHQELWPEGFEWSYTGTFTCAIGLCKRLYNQYPEEVDTRLIGNIAWTRIFASADDETEPVMLFGLIPLWDRKLEMSEITPDIVADRIDNWLEKVNK